MRYRFSAWYKIEGKVSVSLEIQEYLRNCSGYYIGRSAWTSVGTSPNPAAPEGWYRLVGYYVPTAGTREVKLSLRLVYEAGTPDGSVMVDDVYFGRPLSATPSR